MRAARRILLWLDVTLFAADDKSRVQRPTLIERTLDVDCCVFEHTKTQRVRVLKGVYFRQCQVRFVVRRAVNCKLHSTTPRYVRRRTLREPGNEKSEKQNHKMSTPVAEILPKKHHSIRQLIAFFSGPRRKIADIVVDEKYEPKLGDYQTHCVDQIIDELDDCNHARNSSSIVDRISVFLTELRKNDADSLYGHSLGVSVSLWDEFKDAARQAKYNLLIETARCARQYFCADEVIEVGAGHDIVFTAYAAALEMAENRNKSVAQAEIDSLKMEIRNAKAKRAIEKHEREQEKMRFSAQLEQWNKVLGIKKRDEDVGSTSPKKRKWQC